MDEINDITKVRKELRDLKQYTGPKSIAKIAKSLDVDRDLVAEEVEAWIRAGKAERNPLQHSPDEFKLV